MTKEDFAFRHSYSKMNQTFRVRHLCPILEELIKSGLHRKKKEDDNKNFVEK